MRFTRSVLPRAPRDRSALLTCGVAALALLLIPPPALAQFDNGQISGFVRDTSGGIVPGATVTATNQGNGQQRVAVTNSEGYYVFPSLLVGSYDLAAEIAGFSRYTTKGVRVSAAARISVDVTLTVGSLTDAIEVQAAAILTESPCSAVPSESSRFSSCR